MSQASLQAAFVLHHRPFRDTSVIADLLTPDYGRISVVARGARSPKSRRRVLLQPFRPLLASWVGRSNLQTLAGLEDSGMPLALQGQSLACAYYITELALRLIPEAESNATAFALYARTLSSLANLSEKPSVGPSADPESKDGKTSRKLEPALRLFELDLLDCLGLLPDLSCCDSVHGTIVATSHYQFNPLAGTAILSEDVAGSGVSIRGQSLLAMAQREFTDDAVLVEAKRLMRQLMPVHLGYRPLKSRDVFAQYQTKDKNEH